VEGGRHLPTLLRGSGPIEENMLGFMISGLGTTAAGAAWAAWLLARYPDWQEKVREEATAAPAAGRAAGSSVARQVAQEALRLYPPAPILARAVLKRTVLEGFRLWPGQTIIVPVYAIHRHRSLWDRPDSFDPAASASPASTIGPLTSPSGRPRVENSWLTDLAPSRLNSEFACVFAASNSHRQNYFYSFNQSF
jgi:hypothetical protein